jgi:hypothetical protein
MVEGQTAYLHALVYMKDLQKVISHGIIAIHKQLNTTFNKSLHVLTRDQHTANDLAPLLQASTLVPIEDLGRNIEESLLNFYSWERLTNVALNTLSAAPAL